MCINGAPSLRGVGCAALLQGKFQYSVAFLSGAVHRRRSLIKPLAVLPSHASTLRPAKGGRLVRILPVSPTTHIVGSLCLCRFGLAHTSSRRWLRSSWADGNQNYVRRTATRRARDDRSRSTFLTYLRSAGRSHGCSFPPCSLAYVSRRSREPRAEFAATTTTCYSAFGIFKEQTQAAWDHHRPQPRFKSSTPAPGLFPKCASSSHVDQ
jgi:hypothetical protein